jgi:hypothetical protein
MTTASPGSVLAGIGGPLDCVRIVPGLHIEAAMNSEPFSLPPLLHDALMAASSIDSVTADLCSLFNLMTRNVHNGGYNYAVHSTYLEEFSMAVDIFYRENGYRSGDPFYSSEAFVVIDCYKVYAMEDNDNIAESGLFDTTVGFWVSPVRDNGCQAALDSLNDRLSSGYSSYPCGELEDHIDSPITYHKGRYLARIKGIPYLCKIEPIEPYYGG